MSKRWTTYALVGCLAVGSLGMNGCYGKFNLTRKLYAWNGSLGDKWINSLVMFAFFFLPVYGVAGAVDYLVLNTIEFWTGANPVTMAPNQRDVHTVWIAGKAYIGTATQNKLELVPLEGGASMALTFDPQTKIWFAESAGQKIPVGEVNADETLTLLHPDGQREIVSR